MQVADRLWRSPRRILFGLVGVDLLLICGHLLNLIAMSMQLETWSRRLDIGTDTSIAERFNHLKWLGTLLLLGVASIRSRNRIFAAWAIVFLIIFVADFTMLHERGGRRLVAQFGIDPVFRLRAQDIGELLVWAGLGTLAALALGAAYATAPHQQRRASQSFVLVLVSLIVCGVVFDMIHSAGGTVAAVVVADALGFVLGVMEDGGEMLVGSVGLSLAWTAASHRNERPVLHVVHAR